VKFLISAIVIVPLAAALPAASQTLRTPQQSTPIRLAAISDTERTTYTEKARAEMLVWQQKLHDFGERSKVKATDAQTRATNDLNQAWADTEAASARLESAAAEDWESAKTSFRKASDQLAVAWRNIGAEAK
jgi:hypothetical protein